MVIFEMHGQPIVDMILRVEQRPSSLPVWTNDPALPLTPENITTLLANSNVASATVYQSLVNSVIKYEQFDCDGLDLPTNLLLGVMKDGTKYLFAETSTRPLLVTQTLNRGDMKLVPQHCIESIVDWSGLTPTQTAAGTGTNTFQGLAQLGYTCKVLGMVGRDVMANQYKLALKSLGIKTQLLVHATAPTGRCLSIVEQDGERTMLTHIGAANEYLTEHLRSPEEYQKETHYHCEGHSAWKQNYLETYLKNAHDAGATTSLDLGGESTVLGNLEAFKTVINNGYVSILVGNLTEMSALTGISDPKAICESLGTYCNTVIVTLGSQGCWAINSGLVQSYPAKQLDEDIQPNTTGAGDAFLAGFLAGFHDWLPMERSIQMAATMAWGTIQTDSCDYWNLVKEPIAEIRRSE